jgi:hypothetical protein
MKFFLYEEFLNIWKKSIVFTLEILQHFSIDIMEHYYESTPNIPKALVSLSVHYFEKKKISFRNYKILIYCV